MRVDSRAEDHGRSGPRIKSMQPSVVMDGQQASAHRCPPDTRRSSKSKAPPPPPVLHGVCVSPHTAMDQKENLLEQELLLTVVLPEGVEKTTVVHGSKPMMDLLVMLCAKYHLNPSGHTIELVSTNRNHIKFKPNALIGSLEAEKVLLKPKGMEDKSKKTGPQMPEATVRMVINYRKTQKTILRVNPRLPLQELLPAICEKCEFEPPSTVLLRNVHSEDPLDLRSSLSELGLREVYARDTRAISPSSFPPSPTHSDLLQSGKDKLQKEKENKGLFGMFKRGSKKKQEQASTVSAPVSPVHRKQRPVSMSALSTHSPTYDSNTMPSDTPKKRRAPLPPHMISSEAMPSDLRRQNCNAQSTTQPDGSQVTAALSRSSSTGSSLKRSKRKAPPPPTSPSSFSAVSDETPHDRAVTGLPLALEEIQEKEETPTALIAPVSSSPIIPSPDSPSPVQELLEDDSSINLSADISMDSGREGTASPSQDSDVEDVEDVENVASPGGSTTEASCDLITDGKLAEDSEVNGHRPETDDSLLQPADNADFEKRTETISLAAENYTITKNESTSTEVITQEDTFQGAVSSHTYAVTHAQQAEPQAPPRPGLSATSGQVVQDAAPAVASMRHTHAQIQTETPCTSTEPESSPSPKELNFTMPSGQSSLKRDMATSTEELCTPEVHSPERQPSIHAHAPDSQTSTHILPSEGQLSTPVISATTAGSLQYIAEYEPKPKPSNELTRNYIPKVGMTTYTIVPQKSLEKLRFFEVELTLESPSKNGAQELSSEGSEGLGDPFTFTSHVTAPPQSANGPTPLLRSSSSELSQSVPSSPASPETGGSAFTTDREGPEVKEKKVPPAIRPKPASFRLPQHKRTPGSYVSSAAVRSMSVSDSSSSTAGGVQWETLGSPQRKSFPGVAHNFPPSPPPIQAEEEKEAVEVHVVSPSTQTLKQEEPQNPTESSSPKDAEVSGGTRHSLLPRQMSLPSREPTAGLTVEKLRSFAAPKPYSATMQSRFAQAVSSAVKRSQSLSISPVGQHYGHKVPLALTKRSTIEESFESPTTTDLDSEHEQRNASSETPTPPASCSDPAQSSPHTEAPHTEGTWKNGTADLSSGCVVSPVMGPAPKSLQDAAQCQEE